MPANVNQIIAAANVEWSHWGKSSWNLISRRRKIGHTDDEREFAQYVIDKYCAVGGGHPSRDDISDDRYYWSAVGVSAIMAGAGFDKSEFPFAQSHSVFIRHFVAARKAKKPTAFWGFRVTEKQGRPEVGDIIGYARGRDMTFGKAQQFFDRTGAFDSHTDVVVAKRSDEIDVIGANVLDSVTKKTLAIGADGLISDRSHPWFVVLKKQ